MIERAVARAIALDAEQRVLLGLRSRGHSTGKWSLFGGKIDQGESPREAVVREFREETNASLSDLQPVFDGQPVTDHDEDGETLWKTYYFSCRILGRIVIAHADQQSEGRFFTQAELQTIPIAFGHDQVLHDFYTELA